MRKAVATKLQHFQRTIPFWHSNLTAKVSWRGEFWEKAQENKRPQILHNRPLCSLLSLSLLHSSRKSLSEKFSIQCLNLPLPSSIGPSSIFTPVFLLSERPLYQEVKKGLLQWNVWVKALPSWTTRPWPPPRLLSTTTRGICTNWMGLFPSFKAWVRFKIFSRKTGKYDFTALTTQYNFLMNSNGLLLKDFLFLKIYLILLFSKKKLFF